MRLRYQRRGAGAPVCRGPALTWANDPVRAAAFTLIELLLTVTLILLLLGAVVFSFSTLQRGATLEEGTTQLEALLRFARAHAAGSGRQVQINFEEELDDGLSVPLGNLRVLWEPDPLGRPGVFEPLPEAHTYVSGITELISIEDVRPLESRRPPALAVPAADASGAESAEPFGFAPLTFYPDGSSDSIEIVLASRDAEDNRLIALQFVGVTGTFRRRLVPRDEPMEPADSPRNEPEPTAVLEPAAAPAENRGIAR